jgi:hypothetical protein
MALSAGVLSPPRIHGSAAPHLRPHARHRRRSADVIQRVGYAVGGRGGERLLGCLGLTVSNDTICARRQAGRSRRLAGHHFGLSASMAERGRRAAPFRHDPHILDQRAAVDALGAPPMPLRGGSPNILTFGSSPRSARPVAVTPAHTGATSCRQWSVPGMLAAEVLGILLQSLYSSSRATFTETVSSATRDVAHEVHLREGCA